MGMRDVLSRFGIGKSENTVEESGEVEQLYSVSVMMMTMW